jgi:outer membrane lipopolysaccharide assembly protein LptE/RlpB
VRITSRLSLWALVLAALLTAGCGYHFAASGSGLPSSARTIYVARFGNKSRFTGANDEFMRYLKDEIANRQRLELVDNPANADLRLTGDISYIDTAPMAFNVVNEPTLYNQTLIVNATLVDTRAKTVVWSTRGMSTSQQFPTVAQTVVTTSPTFLQQNLRSQDIAKLTDIQIAATQQAASQQQVMQQLAQNLYASMSEGF